MADSRDCQMSLYFSGSCGIYSHFPSETENVRIGQCKRDITSHMYRTHLSNSDASSEHRSLTLSFLLNLYILYVVEGRTVTPLLHKLFLGELHRYYSGYNLVRIPFEKTIACSILRPILEVCHIHDFIVILFFL